jgi:low temperature requirement protein LtrA
VSRQPDRRALRLRETGAGEQRTTNLELFFDLVYVFAVTQLSHLLLHDLTWSGAAKTAFLLLVVWWAWINTTWMVNWFDPDWVGVRMLLMFGMLASLGMAIAIPDAFGARGLLFAGSYVALQLTRDLFGFVSLREGQRGRETFLRLSCWCLLTAGPWVAGALVHGEARVLLWALALGLDYLGPAVRYWVPGRGEFDLNEWDIEGGHFAERFQLFIIIALGESIVATGATASELPIDAARAAAVIVAFAGSAALWWLYFDEVAVRSQRMLQGHDERGKLGRNAFTYLHIPIVAGIIVAAVGDDLLVAHPQAVPSAAGLACIVGGPVIYLLGQLGFRYAMIANVTVKRVVATAALVVWGLAAQHLSGLAVEAGVVVILVALLVAETRNRLREFLKLG